MKTFLERLKEPKPMIYDGGFGSELFANGIELANSALANEQYPQAVVDIHTSYIDAGTDAIGTNTFVVSPLHLEMAGKSAAEAEQLVTAASNTRKLPLKKAVDRYISRDRLVPLPALSKPTAVTPTSEFQTRTSEMPTSGLLSHWRKEGWIFFCIETMFSAKEAAIAVDVARKVGIPIAVNLTYKYTKDRRTGEIIYKTDWDIPPPTT